MAITQDPVPHDRPAQIVVQGPGEGPLIRMGQNPDVMHLKAAAVDTSAHFALLEYHAVPGSDGVPLHMHDAHDEGFYILEGALEMQLGDTITSFPAGSFVFVPRGVAHRFANPDDAPCIFLATFSPAGFEEFFDRRLQLMDDQPLDSPAVLDLATAHGVTYLDRPDQAVRRVGDNV